VPELVDFRPYKLPLRNFSLFLAATKLPGSLLTSPPPPSVYSNKWWRPESFLFIILYSDVSLIKIYGPVPMAVKTWLGTHYIAWRPVCVRALVSTVSAEHLSERNMFRTVPNIHCKDMDFRLLKRRQLTHPKYFGLRVDLSKYEWIYCSMWLWNCGLADEIWIVMLDHRLVDIVWSAAVTCRLWLHNSFTVQLYLLLLWISAIATYINTAMEGAVMPYDVTQILLFVTSLKWICLGYCIDYSVIIRSLASVFRSFAAVSRFKLVDVRADLFECTV
jgi:hypothetical protein